MAAMSRLNRIWRCNTIRFASKLKLYNSLVAFMLLYGHETWTLLADSVEKDPDFPNQVREGTPPCLLFGAQDQRLGAEQDQLLCGSTGISSGTELSRDGNLHGSGMSDATTASPKPSFRAPWKVGDGVVGRGNAGWTTSKSEHPCSHQNCSQGLLPKWLKEDLCRIVLRVPPTTQAVKGLNLTELFLSSQFMSV